MSQAGELNSAAGPVPPTVPTSFTTDIGNGNPAVAPGSAIPSGNNLEILGGTSTLNNVNGIQTDANPNGGKILFIELTNRFRQVTTTVGAVNSIMTILTALAAGTYVLDMEVGAFATAGGPAGNGYTIVGAVISNGVTATLLPNQQKDSFEQTIGANAVLGVSGNTVTVTVTGVIAFSFDWSVTGIYTLTT